MTGSAWTGGGSDLPVRTDLVVVGGGPVGLVTAADAALRGLRVVVVNARDGDGDKACGEGLMPSALLRLRALGVDPPGRDFRGIRYVSGAHAAESRFPGSGGRGVRRTALVASLRERLVDLGVPSVRARVQTLQQDHRGVTVAGVHARYCAVADGLHSPLRRSLGLVARPSRVQRLADRRWPTRYGLRRHVAVAPWTDLVEVHWAGDCEAYVTPVGDHEVGVAVLCAGGAPYEAWLTRFPTLQERFANATATSTVRGAGPLRQVATQRVAGRAMLVGDAAGYVDALTGEGLAVGFAAAARLLDAVVADRPEDYEAGWREVTRRPRVVTEALLAATRSRTVRRHLVPAAARMPTLFDAAVRQLA